MSHFCVYVFTKKNGRDVEELLRPYDENIVYAPYVEYTKEQAIVKVRKDIEEYKNGLYAKYLADPKKYEEECHNDAHLDYIKNEFPKKLKWTDEQCYEYEKQYFDNDMIDENGNLLSTYNPNSKWDWYDDNGGRWSGCLINNAGRGVSSGNANEINWEKTSIPFAFVDPIGRWFERGKMGWWAIVSDEKEHDNWDLEFKNFLKTLDDDTLVTVVDCHI